jgi:hypothetical protein
MSIECPPLEPGEHLLWEGRPDFAAYLENSDFPFHKPIIPAAVLIAGLLAAGCAYFLPAEGYDKVAAIAFLASLILTYACYRVRRDTRRIAYALTDQRAIIELPGWFFHRSYSVPFSHMTDIVLHDGKFGDVLFAIHVSDYHPGNEHFVSSSRYGFFRIENPRHVMSLLYSAMATYGRYQSPTATA